MLNVHVGNPFNSPQEDSAQLIVLCSTSSISSNTITALALLLSASPGPALTLLLSRARAWQRVPSPPRGSAAAIRKGPGRRHPTLRRLDGSPPLPVRHRSAQGFPRSIVVVTTSHPSLQRNFPLLRLLCAIPCAGACRRSWKLRGAEPAAASLPGA